VPDPIASPTAGRPVEAVEVVSLAVSDGDLEAALAQYEAGAVLQPWAGDPGGNTGAVADALMDLRLSGSAGRAGRRPCPDCRRAAHGWHPPGPGADTAERGRRHGRETPARRQLTHRRRCLVPGRARRWQSTRLIPGTRLALEARLPGARAPAAGFPPVHPPEPPANHPPAMGSLSSGVSVQRPPSTSARSPHTREPEGQAMSFTLRKGDRPARCRFARHPEPQVRPSTRSTHWLTHTASAVIRKDNHHD
jgi:hypothetical protein